MRKKLFTILLIVPLLGASLFESKLEKGYNALYEYNYFEAKRLFYKALKKHECGASFGLSSIYLNNKNPFYNLDSARVYALNSLAIWELTKQKEKEKIILFQIDSLSILHLADTVAYTAFDQFRSENTLEGYEYYLTNYSWSNYIEKTKLLRDQLAFELAKSENTARAYAEFINIYPNALQINEAIVLYDQRIFEETTSIQRIKDYEQFLLENPNSPHRQKAEDQIFILATSSGELVDYLLFIRQHPTNSHINEAWYEVYKARTEELTLLNLMEFRFDFPTYPMLDDLKFEINQIQQKLIPATDENKWGFIDTTGNWVLQPQFDFCEPYSEGMALIENNERYGFVDLYGELIIDPIYEEADYFNRGVAIVFNGEYYGAINRFGKIKIPFEYDDIGEFVDGIAYALKNGNYGYIDVAGKVVVPFVYQQAFSISNNRALVKQNDKYGIINKANKIILPFDFDWIEPNFSDTLIKVKAGDKFGIIALSGDTLLPLQYDKIGRIDNDPILVIDQGKVGYYSRSGDWVILPKYESDPSVLEWGEFSDGLARIRLKGNMGVIDTTDTRIVPAIFENMGSFKGVLFPIKKRGMWGYADHDIKLRIKYTYDMALSFIDSLARVKLNNKWGMIDIHGEEKIALEYKRIQFFEGYYVVENDFGIGLINLKGQFVLPVVFDGIIHDEQGFLILIYKGKLGYFDYRNHIIYWKESGFDFALDPR